MRSTEMAFRHGNPNLLMFRIVRADLPFMLVGDKQVIAELRHHETDNVRAQVALTGETNLLSGVLPSTLEPRTYVLAVRIFEGGVWYRVGVTKLRIYPAGALEGISQNQVLSITITETNTPIELALDATPYAAIAAGYVAQAQALVGNVMTLVEQDDDSITLGFGGSIQVDNHPEDPFPYLEIDIL